MGILFLQTTYLVPTAICELFFRRDIWPWRRGWFSETLSLGKIDVLMEISYCVLIRQLVPPGKMRRSREH